MKQKKKNKMISSRMKLNVEENFSHVFLSSAEPRRRHSDSESFSPRKSRVVIVPLLLSTSFRTAERELMEAPIRKIQKSKKMGVGIVQNHTQENYFQIKPPFDC
jgi:hypothetical protein